jgi:hypothetical protein
VSAQRAAAKEENRNCSVAAVPVGTSALTASGAKRRHLNVRLSAAPGGEADMVDL